MHINDVLKQSAELAISRGLITGIFPVNKFGKSPAGIQATATDIWDLANATPTQQIWLAPTAARLHAIVSADATDNGAKGILTLAANIANTKTVTIGTKVYTFQTTLTNVDGNVLIGVSASASIDNLIAAINLAAGGGTTYAAATTINSVATMVAVAGAGDTMDLYVDSDDLTIATTETDANASWGAATLVGGTGARKIKIYGLKTWADREVSEIMWLRGTVSQDTTNSYVIIHRMEVLQQGGTNINAGAITATAAVDATITAVILADQGQTQMAILGIPSNQKFYFTNVKPTIIKGVGSAIDASFTILVCPNPDVDATKFLTKDNFGVQSTGQTSPEQTYLPYKEIVGPAIIKISAIGSVADINGSASFDGFLVDNQ